MEVPPEGEVGQVDIGLIIPAFVYATQFLLMPLVVKAQMVVFVLFGREQLVLSRQRMLHKE